MTMLLKVLALLLAISCALCTDFRSCPGNMPAPIAVDVNNCNEMPCTFVKGTDVIADVLFQTPSDTDSFAPKIVAIVSGTEVEFPGVERNGCKSLTDAACPLEEDEIVTYQLKLPIAELYPEISLDIRLTLHNDDTNEPLACFEVSGRVKAE